MSSPNPPIAVLGAGSWGTALAWLLGEKGQEVRLWSRDAEQARALAETRENPRYLPGLTLPPCVHPTSDLRAAVSGARVVVAAVPAGGVRETLRALRESGAGDAVVVIAAKGLERLTGRRLTEVACEELGEGASGRVAVLSGPNLAVEVTRRVPSASVVAVPDAELARELQATFGTAWFRVYTNPDRVGVELGGALKNPVAIAAGISDGIGYGDNTKATLLTRGLAEMTRLGAAAGARAETFSGLSGLGDLVATASSPLSRNYRLGRALGEGAALDEALASLGQVAEGVPTTEAACRLAADLGVDVPIMKELRRVLWERKPVVEAVTVLMTRPYRDESGGD